MFEIMMTSSIKWLCDTVPNISDAKNDKNGESHLYSGGSNLALSVLYPIVLLGNLYGATI